MHITLEATTLPGKAYILLSFCKNGENGNSGVQGTLPECTAPFEIRTAHPNPWKRICFIEKHSATVKVDTGDVVYIYNFDVTLNLEPSKGCS